MIGFLPALSKAKSARLLFMLDFKCSEILVPFFLFVLKGKINYCVVEIFRYETQFGLCFLSVIVLRLFGP